MPKTIQIEIPVEVYPDGRWHAEGSSDASAFEDNIDLEPGNAGYVIVATVEVPDKMPRRVKGRADRYRK